jgi:opacity protein-like surface antigen
MLKKSILIIFSAFLTTSVFAALPKSSGIYAEGNLGIRNNSNIAFTANAGYKFNNNISFEAGVASLAKTYYVAAAKLIMPFNNGFSIFGKAGITQKINFYGGAGVSYAFTPNWSSSIQGIYINDASGKYAATFGLTYLFPN